MTHKGVASIDGNKTVISIMHGPYGSTDGRSYTNEARLTRDPLNLEIRTRDTPEMQLLLKLNGPGFLVYTWRSHFPMILQLPYRTS